MNFEAFASQMGSERSFELHASTSVFLDGLKSSQLVVEKTFTRKKAQLKQAKVPNGHRSVNLYAFWTDKRDLLAKGGTASH